MIARKNCQWTPRARASAGVEGLLLEPILPSFVVQMVCVLAEEEKGLIKSSMGIGKVCTVVVGSHQDGCSIDDTSGTEIFFCNSCKPTLIKAPFSHVSLPLVCHCVFVHIS